MKSYLPLIAAATALCLMDGPASSQQPAQTTAQKPQAQRAPSQGQAQASKPAASAIKTSKCLPVTASFVGFGEQTTKVDAFRKLDEAVASLRENRPRYAAAVERVGPSTVRSTSSFWMNFNARPGPSFALPPVRASRRKV